MADAASDRPAENPADISAVSLGSFTATLGPQWASEDAYWQSAYPERPYARADRGYEYYRSAYQFGVSAAVWYHDREWQEAESDLHHAWSVHAGTPDSSWEEMKVAIRDAWDHVRGESADDRTHIR